VNPVRRKTTLACASGNANSSAADHTGIAADGSRAQQKKRLRSGLKGYESSDENGEGLLETLAATTGLLKKANTTRKPESAQFLRTADCEDIGRLDSQYVTCTFCILPASNARLA
jgi:hypothetical protein